VHAPLLSIWNTEGAYKEMNEAPIPPLGTAMCMARRSSTVERGGFEFELSRCAGSNVDLDMCSEG
jgi:hypothetical protein